MFLNPLLFFLSILLLAQESLLASSLTPALQKLDQCILKKIKQQEIVGCAVAVVDQGQIVFMKSIDSDFFVKTINLENLLTGQNCSVARN